MLEKMKPFLLGLVIILSGIQIFGSCSKSSDSHDTPHETSIDKENLTLPNKPPKPIPLEPKDECVGVSFTTHTVIIRYGMTTNPEKRAKSYDPQLLFINRCDKVIWENWDPNGNHPSVYHTATGDSLEFDTGVILYGKASKPIQFKKVDEFPYHCVPHPWMQGKIIVTP